jgi:hypothetical protein
MKIFIIILVIFTTNNVFAEDKLVNMVFYLTKDKNKSVNEYYLNLNHDFFYQNMLEFDYKLFIVNYLYGNSNIKNETVKKEEEIAENKIIYQENEGKNEDDKFDIPGDVFLRSSIPALNNSESISIAGSVLLTMSLGLGFGIDYTIIDHLFSPGIYFDIGIHPFTLLQLLSLGSDKDEFEKKTDNEKKKELENIENIFFGFDSGIRIYNKFNFSIIDIKPFFGFTGMIFASFHTGIAAGWPMCGVLLTIKSLGLEYAYCMDFWAKSTNSLFENRFHRIGISYHIK